jgi:hypothetical protein
MNMPFPKVPQSYFTWNNLVRDLKYQRNREALDRVKAFDLEAAKADAAAYWEEMKAYQAAQQQKLKQAKDLITEVFGDASSEAKCVKKWQHPYQSPLDIPNVSYLIHEIEWNLNQRDANDKALPKARVYLTNKGIDANTLKDDEVLLKAIKVRADELIDNQPDEVDVDCDECGTWHHRSHHRCECGNRRWVWDWCAPDNDVDAVSIYPVFY